MRPCGFNRIEFEQWEENNVHAKNLIYVLVNVFSICLSGTNWNMKLGHNSATLKQLLPFPLRHPLIYVILIIIIIVKHFSTELLWNYLLSVFILFLI